MPAIKSRLSEDRVQRRASRWHLYLPWSFPGGGSPPVGARAVCGHVRTSDTTTSVGPDHPEACVVCLDLAGMEL